MGATATLLKICNYSYLDRVQSSRRLERETRCNVELMRLTGLPAPDFKAMADFREGQDHSEGLLRVCIDLPHAGVVCRRILAIAGWMSEPG